MIRTDKTTRFVSGLTILLVSLIAIGAFIISYNALWATAIEYGVPAELAWIWPLLIDFALIVFSLAVVRASLHQEKTVWPWALVAIYTIATIGFNLVHASADPISQVVAIVAPVSLLLSFESLMAMFRSATRKRLISQSNQQLLADQERLTVEANRLIGEVEQLKAKQQSEQDKLANLRQKVAEGPIHKPVNGQSQAERVANLEVANQSRVVAGPADWQQADQLKAEGMTWPEVANELDIAASTAKLWAKKWKELSADDEPMSRNGIS